MTKREHLSDTRYNMFKLAETVSRAETASHKISAERFSRFRKMCRQSNPGSGQALTFGFIAFCILSLLTHGGAVTFSQTQHHVENVDLLMARADRLLNESPAMALLAKDEQLKPFIAMARPENEAELGIESRIIKVLPAVEMSPLEEDLPAQRPVRTIPETASRTPSRGFLGPVEPETPAFQMIIPMKIYRITSRYGWRHGRRHNGLDMAAPIGTAIHAAEAGTVVMAKPYYGYGNLIVIDHGNGIKSRYAHLARMVVKKGAKVAKDQMIGTVGMTGSTTGPHLHFEIMSKGAYQNPESFLLR